MPNSPPLPIPVEFAGGGGPAGVVDWLPNEKTLSGLLVAGVVEPKRLATVGPLVLVPPNKVEV